MVASSSGRWAILHYGCAHAYNNDRRHRLRSEQTVFLSFLLTGELLRPILPVYSKNDKRPELSAVAFDIQGNIYAADKANNRIQKFTFDGNFLYFIGGLHDLHCPVGIVVKRNGDVIVTEYENHRIKVFSQENLGQSITIGAVGVGSGKFSCPRGVALDQHDNIVVADSQNHRIQVVSSTGEPVGTFGMIGSEPGYLDTPYDVAMDPAGNIIVADAKNHRLQVFTRLVPVYTEHATYEEEYEVSVKKKNSDEVVTNNSDEDRLQFCIDDLVGLPSEPHESSNRDSDQKNKDANLETRSVRVKEKSVTTEDCSEEPLVKTKQICEKGDTNNNVVEFA